MTEETKPTFSVEGRIWINIHDRTLTGQGKIELIEKIKEFGSLRKAAAEMRMSYRQAWQIIRKMNQLSQAPLVIMKRGGRYGGSAEISEFAEKVVAAYKKLQKDFDDFLKEQSTHLNRYFFR
jgi:molybdate transport system regulatory protein